MADIESIRSCALQVLKITNGKSVFGNFEAGVAAALKKISKDSTDFANSGQNAVQVELSPGNKEKLRVIFWSFVFQGIIVLGDPIHPNESYPWFFVSAYGKKCVNEGSIIPHDEDQYLNSIRKNILNIDETIMIYIAESVKAFNYNLNISSVIALGASSEKAFLILEQAYIEYLTKSNPGQAVKYEKHTMKMSLKQKFEEFKKVLPNIIVQYKTKNKDHEYLEFIVSTFLNIFRLNRNEAGHPSGQIIEREIVYSNLLAFPSYCKAVYKLINFFKG